MIALDGETGQVYVDPTESVIRTLRDRQEEQRRARASAADRSRQPALTRDGTRIEVAANIGSDTDAARAVEAGAEGVGLFRTEFLFLDRTRPISEEEQYEAYRTVLAAFGDHLVVVRTLDVGGDKQVPGIEIGEELNPFLGLRGIRLTLARPDMMRDQLRALLRAGTEGRLAIMAPMVSGTADLMAFRAALVEAERSLASDGLPFAADYQVGIMIEIPSAALIASRLAPHVDFFSIGTNDLTQYTLAVDRTNREVADRADHLDPAVLKLIGETTSAAGAAGPWVGVCGEMAGDPVATPILIGLGVKELSVAIPSVPTIKERVRSLSLEECRDLAARCLRGSRRRRGERDSRRGLSSTTPGRPGRLAQPSSDSNSLKSSRTSPASSPSTSIVTVVPSVAPSLRIPSMLLALTVLSLAVTDMFEADALARFTNSAAGRAWRPAGLVMVISSLILLIRSERATNPSNRNPEERENRGETAPPAGPTPTATTWVRGASRPAPELGPPRTM